MWRLQRVSCHMSLNCFGDVDLLSSISSMYPSSALIYPNVSLDTSPCTFWRYISISISPLSVYLHHYLSLSPQSLHWSTSLISTILEPLLRQPPKLACTPNSKQELTHGASHSMRIFHIPYSIHIFHIHIPYTCSVFFTHISCMYSLYTFCRQSPSTK